MRKLAGFALFFLGVACWAADQVPLTFNAVLTVGKERRFGVASDDGRHSGWISVGESFEGYMLKSFDEPTQTLVFERDGQTLRVQLAGGGIQALDTKATIADATRILDKMHFEQMLGRMIDQQKAAVIAMSKDMAAKVAPQATPEEFAAYQKKVMDALWAQLKPEELKQELATIYAETFSKDDLTAMGDFYASPAGEALLDKQPEVQQKLLGIMMSRMMAAVPQVQQLQREFMQAQAAKAPAATAPASSVAPAIPAAPAATPTK